ncbi:hypothetical protein EDD29_9100 [Actinocorallia herbida]|uniref:Uncharacterized protein n=1 Tax=Actinocorallia herbida TaxID=58109 RepID=A0A3N1CMV8_9ACTN|nr:hypothetical protein [Actinocorallia herbida]ROO82535.1 hypothetical protein EDD29_0015 [Actinocorallia herbida]ROO91345.1 hypothetical protein EDD29_9100 [Actinocorallia herbida]
MQESPQQHPTKPRQRRPTALPAIVGVALLGIVGIGAIFYQASATSDTPTTPPSPTRELDALLDPASEPVTLPEKERAFVDAVRAAGDDEIYEAYLGTDGPVGDLSLANEGREVCGQPRYVDSALTEGESDLDSRRPTLEGWIEDPPDGLGQTAVEVLCPKYSKMLMKALGGFDDGQYEVTAEQPDDEIGSFRTTIRPGTYRTVGKASDCYWERSTSSGGRLANDFVTNAPGGVTVTVLASDGGFTSEGCGYWVKA